MNTCPIHCKQCHPNAETAWKVIRLLNSPQALITHKHKGKTGGFAYRCEHCGSWHITRQKRESAKIREWKVRNRREWQAEAGI